MGSEAKMKSNDGTSQSGAGQAMSKAPQGQTLVEAYPMDSSSHGVKDARGSDMPDTGLSKSMKVRNQY